MRPVLWLLFMFFALLITIEKYVTAFITFSKKFVKRLVKKRKPTSFLFFRTKIKYFLFGILFSCFIIFPPLVLVIFLQDLPTPQQLSFRQVPQTTKIFDRNGM